ncbi:sigma-70 family RNA polymerase sigma factor [Chitinophaga agrisoli]|uniref:RNA polymerase sigma factor n=1 Tax=Chitinophaga agrisoli TaxID=2607653 RepID=A0A5B2VXE2_9BACT|nr:sigma-70 family RNA polymerase sigma factor [Chitinophaga agrisoli]KAA2242679.1 sigma-70 family RNA polymerase sigma factor [Chitinophaga agrisoli]
MHAGMDDINIINQVLKGDQQGFEELIKRYQSFVFTIALRYCRNREDAEEIAQDVFVKAYRSLADFRRDAKFSTWLYTIAMNTTRTFLRKAKPPVDSLEKAVVYETVSAQHTGTGADLTEQRSTHQLVNHVIGLLSPDDATIITLFYKAEQSIEETAVIMGLAPNTVKVKLHRARLRLKEKLEQFFADEIKEIIN